MEPGVSGAVVRGDAAGEGELPEQPGHPRGVLGDGRVELAVGALQVGVRHHPRPAVAGPADVDDVQVLVPDHPVEVRVDQVEAGRGAPVPEQPRLDVLGAQGFGQQRVAEQVDLPHRQVVGRPPPGVKRVELGFGQRFPLHHGHGPRLLARARPVRTGERALTRTSPQRNLRRNGSCGWYGSTLTRAPITAAPPRSRSSSVTSGRSSASRETRRSRSRSTSRSAGGATWSGRRHRRR